MGQHAVLISGHPVVYNKHTGCLIYKNGTTLIGIFQYADMEFPGINIKYFDSDTKTINKRIPVREIKEIALIGHDSSFNNMDSTFFVRLGSKSRLFRELTFGETKIFDNLFSVDENPGMLGNQMAILQDSTLVFVSNPENLSRKLRKLPKRVIISGTVSTVDIVRFIGR